MTTLSFLVSLVQALAWPLTIVAIVIILRSAISTAVSGPLKRLKAGPTGVELEMWEGKVAVIEKELGQSSQRLPAGRPKTRGGADDGGIVDELAPVAEASPEAAIVEAYSRLEKALRACLAHIGNEPDRTVGGRVLTRRALQEGVINEATANAIEGLAVLRNLAAHGRAPADLNIDRALDYIALVDATLFALRQSQSSGSR